MKQLNFLSPTFFGLVTMSFFLTFFDLKCKSETFATATGIELMTGKVIEKPEMGKSFDELEKSENATEESDKDAEKSQKSSKSKDSLTLSPNPFAILAFVLSLIGIGLFFLSDKKKSYIGSFLAAIVGIMSLIILKFNLENQFNDKLPGTVETLDMKIVADYQIGYYMAMLFFILALFWNIIILNLDKE